MLNAFAAALPPKPIKLAPVPELAVFPPMVARQQTTLVLKEKQSWLGTNFKIVDEATGQPVLVCKSDSSSPRSRSYITDAAGRPLISFRSKGLSSATFIGEDPNGRELFLVLRHFSLGRNKYSALVHARGGDVELTLEGDWLEVNSTISLGGKPVAKLSKTWTKRDWASKETFLLTVAPGADLALLAAVCLAFNVARD